MSLIKNYLYPQSFPPIEKCSIEFEERKSSTTIQGWIGSILTYPFQVVSKLYNIYLFILHKELRSPLEKNTSYEQPWNRFSTFFENIELTAVPAIMKAILKHPRKDPDKGFFNDTMNAEVFLPLLKDLYPKEKITEDDLLLTCHEQFVDAYRRPIMAFMTPQNIKDHAKDLEEIVKATVLFWQEKSKEGNINVTELSHVFTMSVVSKLLLGHPGPFEKYRENAKAIGFISNFIVKRTWIHSIFITSHEKAEYERALNTLREAIEVSLTTKEQPFFGSLVDNLKEAEKNNTITESQIRYILILMNFGGSETGASLLNYLFWQLGQHPEYQEEIFQEIQNKNETSLFELASHLPSANKLFAEIARLFTPAYIIGRQPKKDIDCVIKDLQGKELFRIPLYKNQKILCAPTFAARNPHHFPEPNKFNPHRFKDHPELTWLPFGSGKHSCPGRELAIIEVKMLAIAIVKAFKIESFPKKAMRQTGFMTLKGETVHLKLTERNSK